ncbi:transmembrane protein 268 [Varanus komodoensis]|uniref:transmembrane protein 268 n=1 Tax=Varanus komodoensis TaxID=61221 RepID=UPI001CF79138|nr:transmembrane protein 268 [Varanus komodoensis]
MAEEEEAWPFSISYCWKKEEELSDLWRKELLNGQALLVLTLPQFCSSTPFDVNIWIERLKAMGIQMTVDQWKNLIQHAVLKPEVSKYLFYNSRALGITITVVLYVTLWLNLYSTLITFAAGKPWVVSIVVTLVSLVAALTIRLITLRYQSKMNVNTDMRLAAANEACMKHGFLVGFTVVPDKHRSVPQLWFVHFDVGPCLHSLTDAVAEMKRNQELALKRRLDELRIVIETTILPGLEEKPESSVEESPLLSERRKSSRNAVTFQDFLHLLPEGPPEAMAEQLLTIYSGYYIRLLVSGQLPSIATGRHIALGRAPCLCQFVEKVVLGKQES